jgi:hypothetical protein
MEMSQGDSLYGDLKQTKMSFFFSFTKSENRRAEQVLSGGSSINEEGGREERVREDEYGANTVYTCM